MGNRLSTIERGDCAGPKQDVSFFRTIRAKWIEYFVCKLNENTLSDLDISKKSEMLQWKDFFNIFAEIRGFVARDNEIKQRLHWHPATMGFMMQKELPRTPPKPSTPVDPGPDDDYTDDEASDISDSESDEETEKNSNEGNNVVDHEKPIDPKAVMDSIGGTKELQDHNAVVAVSDDDDIDKFIGRQYTEEDKSESKVDLVRPHHWNPEEKSPIFFGYSELTETVYNANIKETKEEILRSEERAVEKALASRMEGLDEFEKNIRAKEIKRQSRIDNLDAAYLEARTNREETMHREKLVMPAVGFRVYKQQWDKEYAAAETAYENEVGSLRRIHREKTAEDYALLKSRKEDVEAFKDAENQEVPAAERLEEISKSEISSWIDEIEVRTAALEEVRMEYQKMRENFLKVQNNKRKALEMKSSLNVVETKVKTQKRELEEGLECLSDAETLLDRAVRIKEQQDELLPLFQLITKEERPKECGLNIMLACLVILCSGTFDQKVAQVIQAYDSGKTGYYGFSFIRDLQVLFHESFFILGYLPFPPNHADITNATERFFLEKGVTSFRKGRINLFELKEYLSTVLGLSQSLTSLLGVPFKENFGSYQRNKMSPNALLSRCLITPSSAHYRTHYSLLCYNPKLNPEHVSSVHELAMGMGAGDPLQPDYSRFLKNMEKKSGSNVVPLNNGHLVNRKDLDDRTRNHAATVMQTMVRAMLQRRAAEREAKQQAFFQAKATAMEDMKAKVLKEFQKREASEGTSRMKWDAQVRMRQGKLRSGGQNLSRPDVVMIMMEEAIARSREDIEKRFLKIMKKEGIKPRKVKDAVPDEIDDGPVNSGNAGFLSMFGLVSRAQNNDAIVAEDNDDSTIKVEFEDISSEYMDEKKNQAAEMLKEEADKAKRMLEGNYHHDPNGKGETLNEIQLNWQLIHPEPTTEHLKTRLKAIDSSFTDLKVAELLSELPSKRLLMLYVCSVSVEVLEEELKNHFKIFRRCDRISAILKNMSNTDLECGYHRKQLEDFKVYAESGLRALVNDDAMAGIREVEVMLERRFRGSEGRVLAIDIAKAEFEKVSTYLRKFDSAAMDLLATIDKLKQRYNKTMLSQREMAKKEFNIRYVYRQQCGHSTDKIDIGAHFRHNWTRRINTAMTYTVNTIEDAEKKFGEIRCCSKEFLEYARSDAMVIIAEHYQPREHRSTAIAKEKEVAGRPSVCGRGVDGKSYVYEAHNILYYVCLDSDGVFNGCDEYAMKAGGFERAGSIEYFKCHLPRLNVPLMATIDYFGIRVVAVSKSPIEHVVFSDEGEIKKIFVDQLHGVSSNGEHFVNKSSTLLNILQQTGLKLNTAEHTCKGTKDNVAPPKTYCSSELKIYKGCDGDFYMSDFWRSFPSECPEETPHFPPEPRGQSVFWRQLRPEFCRRYKYPLSPDACCAITYDTPDGLEHYNEVKAATRYLVKDCIPKYAEYLCSRKYTQCLADGLGVDLTKELHDQGIGMRHLGLIRGLMWRDLPGDCSIFFNEKCIRTKVDLREEIINGTEILLGDTYYKVCETDRKKITATKLPIEHTYTGLSQRNVSARAGLLEDESNCNDIRSVLLSEMVSRTLKGLIRLYLREYLKSEKGISLDVMRSLYCKYFNIVTGSCGSSSEFLTGAVYEGIRSKFGTMAITPSERNNIQQILQPCTIYIARRLLSMLGAELSAQCVGDFYEHPVGFSFVPMDFASISPIVRHNLPALSYADAMLASMYARELEKKTYVHVVLEDKPPLFLLFSERCGTKLAENKGTLGPEFNAKYSGSCRLEQHGPIATDKFIRGVALDSESKSKIETKYHPSVVPKTTSTHFSLELSVKCTGGEGYNRVVCMNGRFALTCSRDNMWTFMIREGGLHEVSFVICPVTLNVWMHFIVTYDGTCVRCYVNSILEVTVSVEAPLMQKIDEFWMNHEKKKLALKEKEIVERDNVKVTSKQAVENYFTSKEGLYEMKDAARKLLQSPEFQAEGYGNDASSKEASVNMKKNECLRRVKKKYATEKYLEAVRGVTERFKQLRDELEDRHRHDLESSALNSKRPLRIGASVATLASKQGKSYFDGHISCLSIFDKCLNLDRVRQHYMAMQPDVAKDAPRLHSVAACLFEKALLFAGDDIVLLKNYAISLCQYLRVENTTTTELAIARGKAKIRDAIDDFKNRFLPLGIAEILMALPQEYRFADLVSRGFLAILEVEPDFFSRGIGMTRSDIVLFPSKFGLDVPDSPAMFTEAAAAMFKEVSKDIDCGGAYGAMQMLWLDSVKSSHLVVAIIAQLQEEGEPRNICISKLFRQCPQEVLTVSDEDIEAVSHNMKLLVVAEFTRCTRITDRAMKALCTLKSLRVLTLDGCTGITDSSFSSMGNVQHTLEVLSLAGVTSITDRALESVGRQCHRLSTLNVSNCVEVTSQGLIAVSRGCKKLSSVLAAATQLNDDGLATISSLFSKKYMTSLDISFCRDISDQGIVTLADQCPRIIHLNLCGLNRVTEAGTRAVCAHFWNISYLNFEDIFLLSDDVFFYNRELDGRMAADEKMLKDLTVLNMKDCIHITDTTLKGLQSRCAKINTLILQGCHQLTDRALEYMYQTANDSVNNMFPMCDSIKCLNIASCLKFTAPALCSLFKMSGVLEEIDLSGITCVNDAVVQDLCEWCPTVQKLHLRRCIYVSDMALCTISSCLWLEYLDISSCSKITNAGIEVLSVACNGLVTLIAKRVRKITNKSINILFQNCSLLKELDIRECDCIDTTSLDEYTKDYTAVKVTHDNSDKEGQPVNSTNHELTMLND